MYKAISLLFVCCLSYSVNCFASDKTWISFNSFAEANLNRTANQETLIKFLNNPNPDEVEFGIRFSVKRTKELNFLPVYETIWSNSRDRYPALNMQYLRQPIILLAVVGAISKAKGGPSIEQYNYVRNQLKLNNEKTIRFSILALGYVGSKNDIDDLIETSKLDDGEYLIPVVFSILEIDSEYGIIVLREYQKEIGLESRQSKIIDDLIKAHAEVGPK